MAVSSSFWLLLTRLGEAQILFPLALVAAVWLWLKAGQAELARRWLICLSFTTALTTASKLAFIGWGWGWASLDFTGISGHAMVSGATLPMLVWAALLGRGQVLQYRGVVCAFGLAALIAYSRLEVGAHSTSEAVAGFALGALASLMTLPPAPQRPVAAPLWLPVGVLCMLLLLPLNAPTSRSHDWVTQLSLQLSGRVLAFQRRDLHRPPSSQQQQQPAAAPQQQQQQPSSLFNDVSQQGPLPKPTAAARWHPAPR